MATAEPKSTNGLAIAALVVGIVAIISGWAPFWGFIVGVAAIVLGILGLKRPGYRGMSIAGIVMGGIGTLWGLIVSIIVIFGIIALGIGGATANGALNEAAQQVQTEINETTPAQPSASKEWGKVYSLSGTSSKRSGSFTLTGADARLKYSQTGGDFAATSVYIVEKGDSLEKSGGFPEVTITGNKKDSTQLAKSAGEYYLDVSSANASWALTVEEYK